jgi:predicted PurR-regulated permease PerM
VTAVTEPIVVQPDPAADLQDSSPTSITQALLSPTAQSALWKILDFSSMLFAAVLIPFYFWFFSVEFPTAVKFLGSLVPASRKEKIFHLAGEMDAAVAGFVRGRILIAAGMGVMFAGGWWINGVPYALTLGLLAGILSIVPYLGLVVIIPAIALLAANQLTIPEADRMAWYWIVGGPPLVFTIVQSIEGYLLTPVFAGRATNLGPVSIFVAVLAGASVAGLYGMLLAIPVAACAKILIRETIMPSLRNWAAGKSSDPLPLDRGYR